MIRLYYKLLAFLINHSRIYIECHDLPLYNDWTENIKATTAYDNSIGSRIIINAYSEKQE